MDHYVRYFKEEDDPIDADIKKLQTDIKNKKEKDAKAKKIQLKATDAKLDGNSIKYQAKS